MKRTSILNDKTNTNSDYNLKNAGKLATKGNTIPEPGRAISFEEAKAWAFKKYDGALRELAK